MNRSRLGRLHLLTDTLLQQRFSHVELANQAFSLKSSEIIVQYRNKFYDEQTDSQELAEICALSARQQATLLINDRVDLAARFRAGGVHVGADDTNPETARQLLGPDAVIGLTVHNKAELARANELSCIDYVGIGPVYGTQSKATGLPELGLARLKELASNSRHPVIAIGGISIEKIPEVLAQGAYGVALLSAWVLAEEPVEAVEKALAAF